MWKLEARPYTKVYDAGKNYTKFDINTDVLVAIVKGVERVFVLTVNNEEDFLVWLDAIRFTIYPEFVGMADVDQAVHVLKQYYDVDLFYMGVEEYKMLYMNLLFEVIDNESKS